MASMDSLPSPFAALSCGSDGPALADGAPALASSDPSFPPPSTPISSSAARAWRAHALFHAVASWEAILRLFPSHHERLDLLRKQPKSQASLRTLARLMHTLPASAHHALWLSVVGLVKTINRTPRPACDLAPDARRGDGLSGQPAPPRVPAGGGDAHEGDWTDTWKADGTNGWAAGEELRPRPVSREEENANPEAVLLRRFSVLALFLGAFVDHQTAVSQRKRRLQHGQRGASGLPRSAEGCREAPGNDNELESAPSLPEQDDRERKGGAALCRGSGPVRRSLESRNAEEPPEAKTAGGCTYAPPMGVYVVASFLKNNCFRLRLPRVTSKTPKAENACDQTKAEATTQENIGSSTEAESVLGGTDTECSATGKGRQLLSSDANEVDAQRDDRGAGPASGAGGASRGGATQSRAVEAAKDASTEDVGEELRLLQWRVGDIVVKLVELGLFVSAPAAQLQAQGEETPSLGRQGPSPPAGSDGHVADGATQDAESGEIQQLPLPGRQSFVLSALLHQLQLVAAATTEPEERRQRLRSLARFARRPHVATPLERSLAAADRASPRPGRAVSSSSRLWNSRQPFQDEEPGDARGRREAQRDVVLEKVLLLVLLLLQPPFPLLQEEGTTRLVAAWWGRHQALRQLFFNNLLGVLEDEAVPLWQLETLGKFFFLAVRLSLASPSPLTLELQQLLRACASSPLPLAHRCRVFLVPFFQQPELSPHLASPQDPAGCRVTANVVSLADAFLWRSLKSPNWQVRFNAVCLWQVLSSSHLALQEQHPEYFIATLKQTLEDPCPSVRLASAAFVSSLLRRCCTSAVLPPSSQMRTHSISEARAPQEGSGVWLLSPAVFSALLDCLLSAAADTSAPLVRAQAVLAVHSAAQPFSPALERLQSPPGGPRRGLEAATAAGHAAARDAIRDLAPRLRSLLHDASPCVRLAAAMLVGPYTDGAPGGQRQSCEGRDGESEAASRGQDLWQLGGRGTEGREGRLTGTRVQDQVWGRCTRDFLVGLLSAQHAERVMAVASLARRRAAERRDVRSRASPGGRFEATARRSAETGASVKGPGDSDLAPSAVRCAGSGGGGDTRGRLGKRDARSWRKHRSAAAFAAATVGTTGEDGAENALSQALWRAREERRCLDSVAAVANAAELHTAGPMVVSRHLARQLLLQLFEAPLHEQAFQIKRLCQTHAPLLYALAAHVGACACEPAAPWPSPGSPPSRPMLDSSSEETRSCTSENCRGRVSYVDRCRLGVALFTQVRAEIVAYEAAKNRTGLRLGRERQAGETANAAERSPDTEETKKASWYRGSLLVEWQAQLTMSAQLLRPHCLRRDEQLLEEQPLLRRFLINSIQEGDLLACLQNTAGGAVLQYSFWNFFVSLPTCVTFSTPSSSDANAPAQAPPVEQSCGSNLFSSLLSDADGVWPSFLGSDLEPGAVSAESSAVRASATTPHAYSRVLKLFVQHVSLFLDGRRCAAVQALHAYTAAHTCHAVLTAADADPGSTAHGIEGVDRKLGVPASPPKRTGGAESSPDTGGGALEDGDGRGRAGARCNGSKTRRATGTGEQTETHPEAAEGTGLSATRGTRRSSPALREQTQAESAAKQTERETEDSGSEEGKRRCLRPRAGKGEGRGNRSALRTESMSESEDPAIPARPRGRRYRGEREPHMSRIEDGAEGATFKRRSSTLPRGNAREASDGGKSEFVSLVANRASSRHGSSGAQQPPDEWPTCGGSDSPVPTWLQSRSEAEVDSALFLDVFLPFLLRQPRLRRWFAAQLGRRLLPLVAALEQQRQLLESEERADRAGLEGDSAEDHLEGRGNPRDKKARRLAVETEDCGWHVARPRHRDAARPVSPGRSPGNICDREGRQDGDGEAVRTLTRRQRVLAQKATRDHRSGESGEEEAEKPCTDSASGQFVRKSRGTRRGEADPESGQDTEASEVSEDEDETSEDDPRDEDFQLGCARRSRRGKRPRRGHDRWNAKKLRSDPVSEAQRHSSTLELAFEKHQELLCVALRQTPVPSCLALSQRGVPAHVASSVLPVSGSLPPSPGASIRPDQPSFLSLPSFVAALEIAALLRHMPRGREILIGLDEPPNSARDASSAANAADSSPHSKESAGKTTLQERFDLLPLRDVFLHASVAFLRALRRLLSRPAFQAPGSSSAVFSLLRAGPEHLERPDDPATAGEGRRGAACSDPPMPLEIFMVAAHQPRPVSRRGEQPLLRALLAQFPRERLTLQRFLFKRALDVFCSLGQLVAAYPRRHVPAPTRLLNPALVELSGLLEPLANVEPLAGQGPQQASALSLSVASGVVLEAGAELLPTPREEPQSADATATQAAACRRGHRRRLRAGGITGAVDGAGRLDSPQVRLKTMGDTTVELKRWRRNIHIILEIYGVVCEHLAFFFSVPVSWERHKAYKSSAGKALFARMLARLPALLEAMFTWVDFFRATSDCVAVFEHAIAALQVATDARGKDKPAQTCVKRDGKPSGPRGGSAKDEAAGLARLSWNSGACVGHAVCDFWQDAVLQGELNRGVKACKGKVDEGRTDQSAKGIQELNLALCKDSSPQGEKENTCPEETQELHVSQEHFQLRSMQEELDLDTRNNRNKPVTGLTAPANRTQEQGARNEAAETDVGVMEENAVGVLRVLLARGVSGKIEATKRTSLVWRFLRTFPGNDSLRSLLREVDDEGLQDAATDGASQPFVG
uniref:HEAT repeat-containing protein n=1 Tax=Neospora caninum (strain Liverpool) TaxID=572307 RepID=A0A0F7UDD0_NEOCL|nr:TPA: HEAT repeat-containing protein [Neospora caninum Liverpool]